MGLLDRITASVAETLGSGLASLGSRTQDIGTTLLRSQASDARDIGMPVAEGSGTPPRGTGAHDPEALYWDPYAIVEQLGFREKPSMITFQTIDAIRYRCPIIEDIIITRVNQVSAFSQPQVHRFDTGYRIRLTDRHEKVTTKDVAWINEMEGRLQTTGWTDDARKREDFDTQLRKFTRDTLSYDAVAMEIVEGLDRRPTEWYAADAKTVKIADSPKLYPEEELDRTAYVQIFDNNIIHQFNKKQMAYGVRNASTSLRQGGYGESEIEKCITVITSLLNSFSYNASFFTQGTVSKGILNLKGAIPEKHLKAFRRMWYQMVSGAANAWRVPVVSADDVQWINLTQSNRDMEFGSFVDFLIKVVCACFCMDPIEVNFKYGNSGGQKSAFESANKSKLVESKDKGLKPLLRFLARFYNRNVIWPLNPRYTLEFVGLDSMTPKELGELNTMRVRTDTTVNELRAESGKPPLPRGDRLLESNWTMAEKMADEKDQRELAAAQIAAQEAAANVRAGMATVQDEEALQHLQRLQRETGMSGAAAVMLQSPAGGGFGAQAGAGGAGGPPGGAGAVGGAGKQTGPAGATGGRPTAAGADRKPRTGGGTSPQPSKAKEASVEKSFSTEDIEVLIKSGQAFSSNRRTIEIVM